MEPVLQQLLEALTPSDQQLQERARCVQYVCSRLQQASECPRVRIEPFGSSASGLILPSSDLDLGLHGYWKSGTPVHLLPRQAKIDILTAMDKIIWRRRMALNGKVERVLHARVPLLKFACERTHMECDLSIKGPDGLVKAAAVKALTACDPAFAALYRLVKLWATEHDINDAQQGTLNSTALMLLVVFYLQQPPQQAPAGHHQHQLPVLPPLHWLLQGGSIDDLAVAAPDGPLKVVPGRLLEEDNIGLWDIPQLLTHATSHMKQQAARWRAARAAAGGGAAPCLTELLSGFLDFWGKHLSLWLTGESSLRANTWEGAWTPGDWDKDYAFSIEDPFDRNDNPARAVRLADNRRGGRAAMIVATFQEAAAALRRYNRRLAAAAAAAAAPPVDPVDGISAAAEEASEAAQQQQQQEGHVPRHRGRHKGPKLGPQAALCVCLSQLFGSEALLRIGQHNGQLTDTVFQAATALAAAAAAAAGGGGGEAANAGGVRNGRHLAAAAETVAAAAVAAGEVDPAEYGWMVDEAAAVLSSAATNPEAVNKVYICGEIGPYDRPCVQALLLLKHTHTGLTPAEVRRYLVAWHRGGPAAAALVLPAKAAQRHRSKGTVNAPRLMTVLKACAAELGLPERKYASKQLKSSGASRSSSKGADGGAGGSTQGTQEPEREEEDSTQGGRDKGGEGLLTIKLMLGDIQLLMDSSGSGVGDPLVIQPPAFVLEACHRQDGITATSHQALQWMVQQQAVCGALTAAGLLTKVQQALAQHEAYQQHQREQLTRDLGAAGGAGHLEAGVDASSSEEELEGEGEGRQGGAHPPANGGHSKTASNAAGGGSSKAAKGSQRSSSSSSSSAKRPPQPYDLLQSCMAHLGMGQPMTTCGSATCAVGKLHRAEVVLPAFKLAPCKSKQTKGDMLPAACQEHHLRFCGYSSSCKVQAIQAGGIPALRWLLSQEALSQRVDDLPSKLPPCAQLLEALSGLAADSEQAELAAAWEEAQEAARAAAAAGLVVGPAEVDVLDGDLALPAALAALLRCCRALGWPPPQCFSQQKDGTHSSSTTTTLHLVGCQLGGEALESMQWEGRSCHGRAAAQTQAALAALRWLLELETASQALRDAGEYESVVSAVEGASQVAAMVATAMAEAEMEQMRLDAQQRQAAEQQERQRRIAVEQRRQQQQLEQLRQLQQAGYPGGGGGYMHQPPPSAYGGYPSQQAVPHVVPPPQQRQHRDGHYQQHPQQHPNPHHHRNPRQQQAVGGGDPERQQHLQQLRAMQQVAGQQLAGRRGAPNKKRGPGQHQQQHQQQQDGQPGVAQYAALAALHDLDARR